MKELAADSIPVALTCRVLKLARAPYYRWLASPVTSREQQQAYLSDAVFNAHRDDPEYGYRLLADEVRHGGHAWCERTIWRVCRDNRWWSEFGKKRATNGTRPGPPAHEDLVRRVFTAVGANRLWLTDMPPQAGGAPPSTPPARASSTCARSRTSTPGGSWATPSATG